MGNKFNFSSVAALIAFLVVGSVLSPCLMAQSPASPATTPTVPPRAPQNYIPKRAAMVYESVWGIASPIVKYAESGEIIRFSWTVVDAEKAKPLNDKKVDPVLIDPHAGVKLVVPSMEKVGQLRQSSTPEAGKSYWMAFSNKGRPVKRGDRVDIVIGNFKAEGLIVQ